MFQRHNILGLRTEFEFSPGTYGNTVCDDRRPSLWRKQLETRLRRAGASCACFFLIPETSAQKSLIPGTFGRPPPPRGRDGLTVDPTSAREIYGIKPLWCNWTTQGSVFAAKCPRWILVCGHGYQCVWTAQGLPCNEGIEDI